jgi:hypothetical protein
MSVYENYLEVEKKVQEACKRAGRNREGYSGNRYGRFSIP